MMIAIAPGAAYGLAKRWPPERFAELIRGIQRDLGATCVLIGGSADRSTGVEVERELQRHPGPALPINLIGQTDLPVLLGLLSLCHGCVSNDSGAMHLAAAAGVPVTALFGPTDECATSPLRGRGTSDGNFPIRNPESSPTHRIVSVRVWCRPCMLRECPIDHRCMTRISAALVLRELAAQVGQASP
jgi:heptosyltransferase-2